MPLSFQRWHRLSSRYVKLFSATVVGFRNDPEDQFQFLSDTAATALQPSTKEETNCVAVVFHSTVQLEWITVPCQLAFNKTLIVCHHNLNKTYLKQGRNVTVLSRSYDECPSGWTKIGPRCHLAIDIHFQNKIQCSKVVGICEGQLVQFNLSDSPMEMLQLQYYHRWLGGRHPKLIYGASGRENSTLCSVVQLTEQLILRAAPVNSLMESPRSIRRCSRPKYQHRTLQTREPRRKTVYCHSLPLCIPLSINTGLPWLRLSSASQCQLTTNCLDSREPGYWLRL